MHYTVFPSPLGELLLVGDELGVRRLCFLGEGGGAPDVSLWQHNDAALAQAREEVLAYLEGRRRSFSIDIVPEGSETQREVWAAMMRIPYGQTRTYGELARRLGHGRAVIAISSASAANPVPLLVPCHRVIAASGIGSYSGGAHIKRHLLALEACENA